LLLQVSKEPTPVAHLHQGPDATRVLHRQRSRPRRLADRALRRWAGCELVGGSIGRRFGAASTTRSPTAADCWPKATSVSTTTARPSCSRCSRPATPVARCAWPGARSRPRVGSTTSTTQSFLLYAGKPNSDLLATITPRW